MSDQSTNSSPKVNPLDPIPTQLRKVDGIDKLRRLIAKELTSETSDDKCSNLPHLLSIVTCVLNNNTSQPPSAVLKPFSYTHGKAKRFIVDIVSSDGTEWCKVSARNPKSLTLLACGGGGFGQKSILDHALDYIECAKQNPCFFKPPSIKFIFTSGISASLAGQLISSGLSVEGEVIQDSELRIHPRIKSYQEYAKNQSVEEESNSNQDDESVLILRNPSLENVTRLNLDITALLAFVSNLTNGHVNVDFTKPILKQQLEMEKKRPQKPILDQIFNGRELWCCQTAMREFQSILSTVGGQAEKYRAVEFLKRIKIVPDHMSERSKTLDIIGNVKLRSLTIFGTGDYYEAVTVTANTGFVRSAKTQGVDFAVFIHESRALTEGKEKDLILEFCTASLSNVNMNTSM